MATKKPYVRGRHFKLTAEEVVELLFADSSDEEVDALDREDIDVLEDAVEEQRESVVIHTEEDRPTTDMSRTENVPCPSSMTNLHTVSEDGSEQDASSIYNLPPLPNFKWTAKCKEPLKPTATKDVEYEKVCVANGTPFEVFVRTCQLDSLIQLIVEESNRYAAQEGIEFATTNEEIKAFLGLLYFMGYHKLPSTRNYWSTEDDLMVPFVYNVMTLKRFELIKRCLHFNNNAVAPPRSSPNFDRAYKIRGLMNIVNAAFQKARTPDSMQSIDERMVKFAGGNIMKQYVRSKPVSWGFKVWMRCGAKSGYTYEMALYTGKTESGVEIGLGSKVVLELTESLIGSGCHIFMDNFFTSPYLLYILHLHGLGATGTVRHRKGLPDFRTDKEMKKGDVDALQTTDRKLNAVKWMDSRSVTVLSNCEPAQTKTNVQRRQKGQAEKMPLAIPTMVKTYNTFMGGVDVADQVKGTYAIDIRSRFKYYLRIAFDVLDTAVVNGYANYKTLNQDSKLSHLQFRQAVVRGLIGAFSSRKSAFPSGHIARRATPAIVHDHMPEVENQRKRCKFCQQKFKKENRTSVRCSTCDVYLCLNSDRNCFREYHE